MPLVTRTNGSGASNLIKASWWNDFKDLLTGIMGDQGVKVTNNISTQIVHFDPNTSPTAGLITAAGNLTTGTTYTYTYTWVNSSGGETKPSPVSNSVVTTVTQKQVQLTNVAPGTHDTVARNIYRSSPGRPARYYVGTINDNVTTAFVDNVSDASLGRKNPLYNNTAGFLVKDFAGTNSGWISQDPGSNGTICIAGRERIEFQLWNVPDRMPAASLDSSGWFLDGTPAVIRVAGSLGIKKLDNTKLAEFKSSGRLIISGDEYQTSAGTIQLDNNEAFDAFDVGEVYQCDFNYEAGTLVCPGDHDLLTRCTHENCPCAMVVSSRPGFLMGIPDPDKFILPVALAGRVRINTSCDVRPRDLLVSDGSGSVRPMKSNENGFVVGFALTSSKDGKVGVFLKALSL